MKKCLLLHNALSLFQSAALPLVSVLALTIFCSAPLSAQNPRISVQGTLKTANGASVPDGLQAVTFRLYREKEGGTILWHEDTTVEVIAGIYSHYLGSVEPLNPADFDSTLYLAVKVGSYELAPRVELAYSPYALSVAFAQKVVCSGAVGDVKYSVLPPMEFTKENGDCWVPMNGDPLPIGAKLKTYFPLWTDLPDAGGAFVRAQEFPGGATRDPGRTSTTAIATVQQDELRGHTHSITDPGHHHNIIDIDQYTTNDHAGGSPATSVDNSPTRDKLTESSTTGITINPTNGAETRPVNINLWVYIRIN